MDNPLISVIVPVYNVEKYLRRCTNSLINQSYNRLEIILVDDGSMDGSGALCDQLEKEDNRIKVIHKENGGLSSARNAGIRLAKGDYITFIDSDDWLELNTYEYCIGLLQKYNGDCVEFNTAMVYDEQPLPQRVEELKVYSGKEILQYYMESTTKTGSYSVCRCLFPRYSFNGIEFRNGKINEDIDFKYKAFRQCKKLIVTNLIKYHYFQTGNSLSVGGLKKRDFDLKEAADILAELTKNESFGTIAFLGKVKQARTPFSLLSKIAYCGIDDSSIDKKEIIRKLKVEHKKNVSILLKAPLPKSRKVLTVMFAVNYSVTAFCINVAKKVKIVR